MTTNARTTPTESSHWYKPDGTPAYEVERADGKGMRKTTLADARKLNLLPSVTTILKLLHKQALVDWLIEQAVLSVLTTPRNPGETDDAFVQRVLHTERVQDQESQKARDRGTEIHQSLEALFQGKEISKDIDPWVRPAFDAVCQYGRLVATEAVLVGDGYAGRTDLVQECPTCWWIWDFKSAKKLPKDKAWPEHRLQASAYAAAWYKKVKNVSVQFHNIRTGNLYISTIEPGAFLICEHEPWFETYADGWEPLVKHWQWANNYRPEQ